MPAKIKSFVPLCWTASFIQAFLLPQELFWNEDSHWEHEKSNTREFKTKYKQPKKEILSDVSLVYYVSLSTLGASIIRCNMKQVMLNWNVSVLRHNSFKGGHCSEGWKLFYLLSMCSWPYYLCFLVPASFFFINTIVYEGSLFSCWCPLYFNLNTPIPSWSVSLLFLCLFFFLNLKCLQSNKRNN